MTSTSDDACQENSLRAIQNEYIVEHLFSFLSVNDIKNCRLANRIWRNIGAKIFRRRTHILFDFSGGDLTNIINPKYQMRAFLKEKNQMKEVGDYCKENIPESTPLSSFAFQGRIEYFTLINFLDDVRSSMKELKIRCAIWHEQSDIFEDRMTVDISSKIPPHLTKLHIQLFYTSLTISLRFGQIPFVKDIYLDNCTILVDTNEKRLSPTDMFLGPKNNYIKNGTRVKFLVNESFDLTLTKRIELNDKDLILDFSDCANDQVERIVTLKSLAIRNWEMCNWKIKKFSLNSIPFLEKNSIEIEELTTAKLTIDLSKIYNPISLLKLYCEQGTTIAETPFLLPNLVDVRLRDENCVAKLPYFTNNKYILEMTLQKDGFNDLAFKINDLPKGIKRLSLIAIEVHGEGVYQVETLCMQCLHPITKYSIVAAKFRSETLVFHHRNINTDEEIQCVIQLLNLDASYRRLVVGSFDWGRPLGWTEERTDAFNNSDISNYVDEVAEYYVFEGRRGKGLTDLEQWVKFFS